MNICIVPTLANFAKIRRYNSYYVDKTGFLEKLLLPAPSEVSLFTRPRRFGKTLMLNMMAEFFDIRKDSAEMFEGLAISRNTELCRQWQNQYPVIFLTLKDIDTDSFDAACKSLGSLFVELLNVSYPCLLTSPRVPVALRKMLQALAEARADRTELKESIYTVCYALYTYYEKPVILLIDEYDVPAAKAYEHGFYKQMTEFLSFFLSKSLKDNPYLAFAVLTGCLRITKESIFTGLNNLKCYGISENRYADSFGFTENEVATMLKTFDMADKMDEVRDWYDGYHFGNREDIYCPWGITNYVNDHLDSPDMAPAAYWLNTSANEIFSDFLLRSSEKFEEALETLLDGRCLVVTLDEQLNYNDLWLDAAHFWTLLYLTGYLTRASEEQVRRCQVVLKEGETALVIPNREVRLVFTKSLRRWFCRHIQAVGYSQLYGHFWDMKPHQLEQDLEHLMQHTLSSFDHHEYVYHIMLLFVFADSYSVHSNRESGLGRYDIVVCDEKHRRAAVIEVKRAKNHDQALAPLAEKALQQIVDKKYDTDLRAEHKYTTLLHYGMAFSRRTCRVAVKQTVLQM